MIDAKGLLDQLLKVGGDMVTTPRKEGDDENSSSFDPLLKGLLAGVGGGMLGSILSGKSNALSKVGGGAALATLAYKAYQNYTQNQGKSGDILSNAKDFINDYIKGDPALDSKEETSAFVSDEDALTRSKAMLIALINAAKADGEFDEKEKASISQEVMKFTDDPSTLAWIKEEIAKPLNIQDITKLVTSPQMATEVYMASVIACGSVNEKEKAYLNDLRKALGIEDDLKNSIEKTLFS